MRTDTISPTIEAAREERGRLMREAICRGWTNLMRGLHLGPGSSKPVSRRPGGHARPSATH